MDLRVPSRSLPEPARGLWRPVVLTLALSAAAAAPPATAQESQAMRSDCRTAQRDTPASRQRAEQWVQAKLKAFLPSPEQALRMRTVELEAEQVKLALYGINTTCEQYLSGKMAQDDADRSLSGFEQTIADFVHDLSGEVILMANRAQVADIDALRKGLTEIGVIGRQAALSGEEGLAEEARSKMVQALVGFSRAFVEQTCWDQVFDDQLPFNIYRQNEILGTDIDVRPCAQRRFTASVPPLLFESCTVHGIGKWRVRWDMPAPGATGGTGWGELEADRDAAEGDYKVEWGANGVEYRSSGKLKLTRQDNGPGNKATYTLSGNMDVRLIKGDEMVKMMAKLMNKKPGGKGEFTVQPQVSDKPCKSLDDPGPGR
jgi:hypothetical protein